MCDIQFNQQSPTKVILCSRVFRLLFTRYFDFDSTLIFQPDYFDQHSLAKMRSFVTLLAFAAAATAATSPLVAREDAQTCAVSLYPTTDLKTYTDRSRCALSYPAVPATLATLHVSAPTLHASLSWRRSSLPVVLNRVTVCPALGPNDNVIRTNCRHSDQQHGH